MNALIARVLTLWNLLVAGLESLQPVAQLAARVYVGHAFFASGLTKIQNWETTLLLFGDDYKVPLLPPVVAAYMGTAGELVLPVLLVFGLGGRFAALGLSVVNLMAVLSLSEIQPAALQQHVFWGSLLAALAMWGPGKLSVDHLLMPRLFPRWFPRGSRTPRRDPV